MLYMDNFAIFASNIEFFISLFTLYFIFTISSIISNTMLFAAIEMI